MDAKIKNAYLEPLLQRAEDLPRVVRQEFGQLRPDQVNWSPAQGVWSIGLCLEHLIHSNSLYFPQFTALRDGSFRPGFWERSGLMRSYFEKMLLRATQPVADKKSKSPKAFRPALSQVDADIVARFASHQKMLLSHLRGLDGLDHEVVSISSPAAKFITYRLKVAVEIIVNHEERHINQAKGVLRHSAFPK